MKKLAVLLITGLVITLTACGTATEQPESARSENTVETSDDNEQESEQEPVSEPVSDPVADTDIPSEESLINDFRDAQDLWLKFEGGMENDYSDAVMGKVYDYDAEFYRVTEPGIGTLQELEDYLSARVDREYVKKAMSETEMYMESDGVLYSCPAGRGDDLSIAWVEFAAETDGESGEVTVAIHRQDFYMGLGDWYENGDIDIYEYPFTLEDGHAIFDSMNFICGSCPIESPIDGYDYDSLETALMDALEGTWLAEEGSDYYEMTSDGQFTYYAGGEEMHSGYIVSSSEDGGSYMMDGEDINGTVFVMDIDPYSRAQIILFDDGSTVFTKVGEG